MGKSFTQTPAPPKPTAEVIAAFERGGAGQDTHSHIPTKAGKGEAANSEAEPTRRLSLDIPESWHRRFKIVCAKTDRKMVVEMLEYLKRRTVELEQE
jgi:hypothetical protein